MGFRIPRKSSGEVRSAGKYHTHMRTKVYNLTYIHTDVVSVPTMQT